MKKSLRQQAFFLTLIGLVVTGLIVLAVVARQRYESQTRQIAVLREALYIPLASAKANLESLPPDVDQVIYSRKVVSPAEGVSTALQNLYDGKEGEGQPAVQISESVRVLVKLEMNEVDQLLEKLKAKTPGADFGKSIGEIQNCIVQFEKSASSQHEVLEWLSWISILITAVSFITVTVWNFLSDQRKLQKSLVAQEQLAKETQRVDVLSKFIEAMATGNYSIELESGRNDELSATLVTMRDKLKINTEEDQRRNWATSGVAQIGEILRAAATSTELYDSIVKFVVKYTRTNQGGLFILNDDDPQNSVLELVACYAFERKKFLTKHLDIGQGMVGQCFLEREKIHLREVPRDYVRITSGLGGES